MIDQYMIHGSGDRHLSFRGGINERFSSRIRLILRVTSMRVSCRFCFMPRYDPQSTKPNVFADEETIVEIKASSGIFGKQKLRELFRSGSVGNKWGFGRGLVGRLVSSV